MKQLNNQEINDMIKLIQSYTPHSIEYQKIWGNIIENYTGYIYSVIGMRQDRDDVFQEFCLLMPGMFERWTSEMDFHSYLSRSLTMFKQTNWNGSNDIIKHNKSYMKKQHKSVEEGKASYTKTPAQMNFMEFNSESDLREYNSNIESEIFLDECWNQIKEHKYADIWWDRNVLGQLPGEIMNDTGMTRDAMRSQLKISGNSIVPVLREIINEQLDYIVTEDKSRTVLNKQQVEEIKTKYKPRKYSMNKLAKEYNTSIDCIFAILKNKAYPSGYTN